jgi:ATP-binding cassette subfamily C protein CydD
VLDALRRLCVGRTAIIATHAKAARSYFGQRLEIADGRAQGNRLAGND